MQFILLQKVQCHEDRNLCLDNKPADSMAEGVSFSSLFTETAKPTYTAIAHMQRESTQIPGLNSSDTVDGQNANQ